MNNADRDELRALVLDILRRPSQAEPRDPSAAWSALAAGGLTAVGLAESRGGSGGSISDAATVLEAVAEAGWSLPLPETAWLAGWVLTEAGRPVPDGQCTLAVAGPELAVRRSDAGWTLDGELPGVRWRHQAAHILIVVPEHRIAVCEPIPPVEVETRAVVGVPRAPLHLKSVNVGDWFPLTQPVDDVLAELRLRLGLARSAQIAGAARGALELAIRYARDREQFGRNLSQNQVIQHYLADMACATHAVTTATHAAIRAFEDGAVDRDLQVGAAKAVTSSTIEGLTRLAHQVLGAIGTTQEHELHWRTMSMWSWREDGGDEYQHGADVWRLAHRRGADLWDALQPARGWIEP